MTTTTKQLPDNKHFQGYTLREIQTLRLQVMNEIDGIKSSLKSDFNADVVAPCQRRSYLIRQLLSGVIIAQYSYRLFKLLRRVSLIYRAYRAKTERKNSENTDEKA